MIRKLRVQLALDVAAAQQRTKAVAEVVPEISQHGPSPIVMTPCPSTHETIRAFLSQRKGFNPTGESPAPIRAGREPM
jgi:hypothetical protein